MENALAKAQSRSAGASISSVPADVESVVKARLPCSGKYAAHLCLETETTERFKVAAVVVGPHHVATVAHTPCVTEAWKASKTVKVVVRCCSGDHRREVDAKVVHLRRHADLALLQVEEELFPPVLNCCLEAGYRYYVHGISTQAQADDTSVSHGMVTATELGQGCHIRGYPMPGEGDLGAGCFAVATGALMGMVVGRDPDTQQAKLLPSAIIAHALAHRARAAGRAGCGLMPYAHLTSLLESGEGAKRPLYL